MPPHPPVIRPLLIVATACADLAATIAIFDDGFNDEQPVTLFLALCISQLSLLCVWVAMGRNRWKLRWLVVVGAIVASFVMTWSGAADSKLDLETFKTLSHWPAPGRHSDCSLVVCCPNTLASQLSSAITSTILDISSPDDMRGHRLQPLAKASTGFDEEWAELGDVLSGGTPRCSSERRTC